MSVRIARKLRGNPTEAETRLWSRIRRRQVDGHRFRRQVPLGPYVTDFVCFDARLIVEVDGGQHADSTLDDLACTAWLEGRGYRVVRFWNNEVLRDTENTVVAIRSALARHPPPHPSPARGEGEEGGR